jgi:uncharacterized protein (TIGR00156 family)
MKKTLTVGALALLLGLPSTLYAQQPAAGGYTGPSTVKTLTVAEVLKMSDDTPVELVGRIEKSLGDEKYNFVDATGSIIVDIDNEDFRGVSVSETDTVKIRGEVDKELMEETTIDVNSVEKVQ